MTTTLDASSRIAAAPTMDMPTLRRENTWRASGFDYDVIVVGARCAGAATAMLLARAGLSVLCVERARAGADTLSTHALTVPGVLQLSRWGVLDEVRQAAAPKVSRVVYHYGDEVVDIPIRPRGDVDGLYAPRRQVLDRILADAAADAGADVSHGTGVRDLLNENGRVVGVTLQSRDGEPTTVRARLVVGADGARSTVARLTGAKVRYAAPHSSTTIYTYVDGLPDDAYHNYFRPGVAAGVIPTNDGQANLWIGLPSQQQLPPAAGRDMARVFTHALTKADPELAAALPRDAKRRYSTFTGARGFLRSSWGQGWALVGDAAYFKDPISAHGMTDALIGAEVLARSVLRMAAGTSERVALSDYEEQRRQLINPMIPAIEHAASYTWDTTSLQRAQLEISGAMRAEWEYLAALGPIPVSSRSRT